MPRTRAELKGFFKKNAIPTQSNFEDLIDSGLNQNDDGVVKLPNDPLTLIATGPEEALLRFSRVGTPTPTPAWLIKQNPAGAPTPGLVFQDAGSSANTLFLQSASGNVGIGTVSPGAALDVAGKGGANVDLNVNGCLRSNNDTGGLWISNDRFVGGAAGLVGLKYGTDWRLAVQGDGKVGIGTTTPGAKLEVVGDGGSSVDLVVNGRLRSNSNDGGLWVSTDRFVGGFGSQQVGFYNGGWQFAVQNDGKIGIGTTAPLGRLTIYEPVGTAANPNTGSLVFLHGNIGGANSIVFRSMFNAGSDYGYIQYQDSITGGLGESARLVLGIQNDPDDHLLLMPSGNVGVNNWYPTAKLHVGGDIAATGNLTAGGGTLTIGSWSLVTDGVHLYIKNGGFTVARFSTSADRFNVFQNVNGVGPYLYFNGSGGTGVGSNGGSPPP